MSERTDAPPKAWGAALAAGRAIGVQDCPGGRATGAAVRRFLTEASADASVGNRVLSFCKVPIDGDIDLKGCSGLGYVDFDGCTIDGDINIEGAEIKALKLDDSTVKSLKGTRARIRGSIYLRWAFTALKGVDLSGSWIEGSLTLRGARLGPDAEDYCLKLRHTTVGGTLYLGPKDADEESAKGDRLSGQVRLDGSIDLSGLRVREFVDHENAYDLIRSTPGRHIVLDGFEYDRLGGMSPTDWRFRVFDWFSLQKDVWTCVGIRQCWRHLWGRLQGSRRRDAATAAKPQFYPQPFERLARVLKDMGHDDDAKTVMYQKREAQHYFNLLHGRRRTGQTRGRQDRVLAVMTFPMRWALVVLYGKVAGYGYRMGVLATVIMALVAIQIAGLNMAANARLIAPAQLPAMTSDWWLNCRDSGSTAARPTMLEGLVRGAADLNRCLRLEAGASSVHRHRDYPAFNAMIFGIEAFFPMLDLGQTSHWMISDRTARGRLLSWWIAVYGILGWIATSLVVAGLFARFNQRGGD